MLNGNIYFLLGTPCSGKTTIGSLLSDKYDMCYFSGDSMRFEIFQFANPLKHPFMTKKASDFFSWSLEEMIEWEKGIISEQTPFILAELEKFSVQGKRVLFEGMLDLEILSPIVDKSKVVFLRVDKTISERDFLQREDHQGLVQNIINTQGITKDEKERRISIRKKACIEAFDDDASVYGIRQIQRTDGMTISDMLKTVEMHYGF